MNFTLNLQPFVFRCATMLGIVGVLLCTACGPQSSSNSDTTTNTVNNPVVDSQVPTVPTNLAATPVSSSQINLTWNAATDNVAVTGYKVFRGGSQIATATMTSYSDTGLSSGLTYSYTVSAYDAAGNESVQSSVALGTTPALDTTLPTVSFTNPTNNSTVTNSVTVTANANDNIGVVGVQFKLDNNNVGSEDTIAPYNFVWNTTANTNTSHTLTAVARDAAGNSTTVSISVTVNNPVVDSQAPTVPTNLAATPVSSSQIKLIWNAAADNVAVTGYKVFRGGSQIATTAMTSYADTGLSSGSTYRYTVSAYDAANNESVQTSVVSATTTASVKSYSTNFNATENPISESGAWLSAATINSNVTNVQTGGGIAYGTMISFDTVNYIDSIALMTGTFSVNQSVQATLSNSSAVSGLEAEIWLHGNITPTTVTGYEVDLVYGSGNLYLARWNGPANNYTQVAGPISANVVLTNGAVWYAEIVGTVITVKCNGTSVLVYDTAAEGASKITSGNPGIGFWNETGSAGNQNKLGWTDFVVDGQAPTVPTNLAATPVASSQINLTWNAAADNLAVTGYKVFRGGSPIATTATTSYADTGLSSGSTYRYTVSAYDAANNESVQTSVVSATTTTAAGTYSTNFNLTENPLNELGVWTNGAAVGLNWHNVQTASGHAYSSAIIGGYDDAVAHLSGFAANQYAQGVVYREVGYNPGSNHEVELLLRFEITANNARGYEVLWGKDGNVGFVRWNGPLGDYSPILDINIPGMGVAVDGDVMRAEITGNIITLYLNGIFKYSVDVTSVPGPVWTTGQPGVGFWPTGSASIEKYCWSSYQAGNL